jgi:hypothetical protein
MKKKSAKKSAVRRTAAGVVKRKKKAAKKSASGTKKAAATKAARAKKTTAPAARRGAVGGVKRAVAAKKVPARRGTRRSPLGAGAATTTARVIRVIEGRTGVRPVITASTLSSLAINSKGQLNGLAGALGREFGKPDSAFNLAPATTVNAIIGIADA